MLKLYTLTFRAPRSTLTIIVLVFQFEGSEEAIDD